MLLWGGGSMIDRSGRINGSRGLRKQKQVYITDRGGGCWPVEWQFSSFRYTPPPKKWVPITNPGHLSMRRKASPIIISRCLKYYQVSLRQLSLLKNSTFLLFPLCFLCSWHLLVCYLLSPFGLLSFIYVWLFIYVFASFKPCLFLQWGPKVVYIVLLSSTLFSQLCCEVN